MLAPRRVSIHYRRLPRGLQVFEQLVLDETPEYTVTFLAAAELAENVTVAGSTVLEPGAPVIWFTYPGEWHDVGRFHLVDGTFTGIYANLLTPVRMIGERWETTDLFLDLWVGADGTVRILDEEEFAEAVERRWIDPATAGAVRRHAERLAAGAAAGTWPPPHVGEWTLARVRRLLAGYSPDTTDAETNRFMST
jgi:predicted RNA-binding protein associated with RNAse of E/G family